MLKFQRLKEVCFTYRRFCAQRTTRVTANARTCAIAGSTTATRSVATASAVSRLGVND